MFIQCRLSHHPQDHPRQCSAYLCIPSCIPANRELKQQTFSTGRRQPEVKFTSDPRFPPTESAVATLRRLCFAYFDVACKT